MPRKSREELMLSVSKIFGEQGTCLRAKVGCVIEKEGRILATGYNGSLPGEPHCLDEGCLMDNGHCIRTVHAEANAICFASKYGISLLGSTLYTTGWVGGSCQRCLKLAISAGVIKVITESGIQWQKGNGNAI